MDGARSCPLHRRAEDGIIPHHFQLKETLCADYPQRTEWNVRDSDATVIFTLAGYGDLRGGTLLTSKLANEKRMRPCLHLHLEPASKDSMDTSADVLLKFHTFIANNQVRALNVAGPRESEEPGIGDAVERFLSIALLSMS